MSETAEYYILDFTNALAIPEDLTKDLWSSQGIMCSIDVLPPGETMFGNDTCPTMVWNPVVQVTDDKVVITGNATMHGKGGAIGHCIITLSHTEASFAYKFYVRTDRHDNDRAARSHLYIEKLRKYGVKCVPAARKPLHDRHGTFVANTIVPIA